MIVKARKQGDELMMPVPASFNIAQDTEFEAMFADGILTYIPVHRNIFDERPGYDLRAAMTEEGIIENSQQVGREKVWDD
jgi:hypothetical protein